ncbi:hypothetical protein Aduo_019026 [Ancylostoma duodenale]
METDKDLAGDVLTIKIFNPNNASHPQFNVVNRPPNSSKHDNEKLFDQLSYSASSCTNTIILGDLNLQDHWDRGAPLNSFSASFFNFFHDCGLHQNVTSPTHKNNFLDVVLSSADIVPSVAIFPALGSSDHNIVCFEISEDFSNVVPLSDFRMIDYSCPDVNLSIVD